MKGNVHGKEKGKGKKEGVAMEISMALRETDMIVIDKMDEYIQRLKSVPQEEACEEAKKALKRTGVTGKTGKPKRSIVSWE